MRCPWVKVRNKRCSLSHRNGHILVSLTSEFIRKCLLSTYAIDSVCPPLTTLPKAGDFSYTFSLLPLTLDLTPYTESVHVHWEKNKGKTTKIMFRKQYRKICFLFFSSVQSLSCVRLFETPWIAAHQASLSITNSRSSLRLTSSESVMPSNHLILCHPLLLLPSIFPSIVVFSSESALLVRWPNYWSFSISSSNEYLGLISFRIDCFYLFAI